MRKHFLILMLMALLPMAGWAADFATQATVTVADRYFGVKPEKSNVTVIVGGAPLGEAKYKIEADGSGHVIYYSDEAFSSTVARATGKETPNVGTYYLKILPNDTENSNQAAGKIIIRQMPLNVTVTNANKTYGDPDPESYTITAVTDATNADVKTAMLSKITVKREAGENVKTTGTYNFNSTTVSDANYTIGTVTGTFTINPKSFVRGTGAGKVTITVSDNVKTYNGKAQAPTVVVHDNDLDQDLDAKDFKLTYEGGNNTNATVATGIVITVTGQRNYASTAIALDGATDKKLIINKKALSIFVDDMTKVYDGTTTITGATFSYSGLVGDDLEKANPFGGIFTANYNGTANKFVGTYALKAEKTSDPAAGTTWNNYDPSYPPIGQLTITQRPVTLTVGNSAKSFGEDDAAAKPAFAYDVPAASGNKDAMAGNEYKTWEKDDKTWLELVYSVVRTNATVEAVDKYKEVLDLVQKTDSALKSTYTLTDAKLKDVKNVLAQYDITIKKGNFEIKAAALTVTPKKVVKTYGEEYNLDDFEVIATNSAGVRVELTKTPKVKFLDEKLNKKNPENAGVYTLVLDGEIAAPGYDGEKATRNEGQLFIQKKALTIVLADQTLMVGDKVTALRDSKVKFLNGTVDGIREGDVIGYKLEFNTTDNVPVAAGMIPTFDQAAVASASADQAKAYNAMLEGAVADGDSKNPKEYKDSEDTSIADGKTYYTRTGAGTTDDPYVYTAVASPVIADIDSYYEEVFYTATTAATYNASLTGAISEGAAITAVEKGYDKTTEKLTVEAEYAKGVKITPVASTTAKPNQNANYDITWAGVTGKLIVVSNTDLVLQSDDNDITNIEKLAAAETAITGDITIDLSARNDQKLPSTATDNRIWDAKQWNTLVLPFDITVEDLSKAFGYAIVNVVDPSSTTTNNVAFKLEMDMIPANTPFLIKTTKKLMDTDATKCISTSGKVSFDGVTPGRLIEAPTAAQKDGADAGMGYKFVPVYETMTVDKDQSVLRFLLGNSEKWAYITSTSKEKWTLIPFTAYVDLTPAGSNAREVTFTMQEADGSTTTIRSIDADGINNNAADFANGWYTINGMKLEGAPAQKGIYIMNGKKVVIK